MKTKITANDFKEMILCADEALQQNVESINELNVFPVPDGDTGTNMSLTLSNAAKELRKRDFSKLSEAVDTTASALLRGARGNSGVILSLLFRGVSKKLKDLDDCGSQFFSAALAEGVKAAYKAVMKPAEGTILTVSRIASDAAVKAAKGTQDVIECLETALSAGQDALANTVNQNPVLKKAGVVDAGGKGYLVILGAMISSLRGEVVSSAEQKTISAPKDSAAFDEFDNADILFSYCTEFIVNRENKTKSPTILRAFLEGIGDSIVLVDDDEIIKVHVHTNDPGKVLTEALTYGSFVTVKIENMKLQHSALSEGAGEKSESAPAEPEFAEAEKEYGFVSVCAGEGFEGLFGELGVDRIVTGGQTMNPSTDDILKEINKTPAETVFVLPNNKNIQMAAEQTVGLTSKKVVVIPTKTVPQGVGAMLGFADGNPFDEIVRQMKEMAANVHTAMVTYAARDSEFDGHNIKAGEYLALMDGSLIGSFADTETVFAEVCNAAESLSPEYINVYYGEGVNEDMANGDSSHIKAAFPDAEMNIIYGGQPVYYYIISFE